MAVHDMEPKRGGPFNLIILMLGIWIANIQGKRNDNNK